MRHPPVSDPMDGPSLLLFYLGTRVRHILCNLPEHRLLHDLLHLRAPDNLHEGECV